jgi:hypothetical protein
MRNGPYDWIAGFESRKSEVDKIVKDLVSYVGFADNFWQKVCVSLIRETKNPTHRLIPSNVYAPNNVIGYGKTQYTIK